MTPPKQVTMPAFIVTVLLIYFGLALFGAPLGIVLTSDSPMVQTLINLTLMAASFFIGTTQASARKDDVIASQVPPPPAPAPSAPPQPAPAPAPVPIAPIPPAPPIDDAFVAIGATRMSDSQVQTADSLAAAIAAWNAVHPAGPFAGTGNALVAPAVTPPVAPVAAPIKAATPPSKSPF